METKIKRLAIIAIIILLALIATMFIGAEVTGTTYTAEAEEEPSKPTLTHRQFVWSYAMEWCESNGRKSAVNEIDRDGTPSYGGYQFKPSTLWYYGKMYEVVEPPNDEELGWIVQLPDGSLTSEQEAYMNYDLQRAVFEQMILHADEIDWYTQFPDCVRRYGTPPKD